MGGFFGETSGKYYYNIDMVCNGDIAMYVCPTDVSKDGGVVSLFGSPKTNSEEASGMYVIIWS